MKYKNKQNRFYIQNSSFFNVAPYYQADRITKIVKENGGKNVRLRNQFDYSNQPKVVTFTCDIPTINKIEQALRKEYNTEWIHVDNIANWDSNKSYQLNVTKVLL